MSVVRPRIRIRLSHEDQFVDLLSLVDSGADDCLFPLEVATLLNVKLDQSRSIATAVSARIYQRSLFHSDAGSRRVEIPAVCRLQ